MNMETTRFSCWNGAGWGAETCCGSFVCCRRLIAKYDPRGFYDDRTPYDQRDKRYYAAKYLVLFASYREYLIREEMITGKKLVSEKKSVEEALFRYFKKWCDR